MNSVTSSSLRLRTLAKQLPLGKSPNDDSNGDDHKEKDLGEGSSQTLLPSIRQKKAAVLVCLFQGDSGDFHVILTKRSANLSSYSGEVALPGGKSEECDKDDVETAVREAKEEIGLDPALVCIVAILSGFMTEHLEVVPVVCILPNKNKFKPVINRDEVEDIFDCPLDMFLKSSLQDENRRTENREWKGVEYRVHFFDYERNDQKYVIWGVTATILIRVASLILEKSPSFEYLGIM